MKEKIIKKFDSNQEKEYLEKEITARLADITSGHNVLTVATDTKYIDENEFIRVTVFVQNKDKVNFTKLHDLENSIGQFFGTVFKFTFCNAEMKFNNSLKLSSLKGFGSISFVDLENLIEKNLCDTSKAESIRNLLYSTINFSNNDAVVICANKKLIYKFKSSIKDFPKMKNLVLIETEGKDCSDFRLVQSIKKLYDLKKLDNYKTINIFSGDKFFIPITEWLITKNINVYNFGQKNKTSKLFLNLPKYSELDALCKLKVA